MTLSPATATIGHLPQEPDRRPGETVHAFLARRTGVAAAQVALDEPTNHLDLPAIEQLEDALDSFPGTVLLVSHDRRLLESVRVTRRLAVEAGAVREVPT